MGITIAVILSAFGVIAYFIFKDKRDYKEAVEAAKEAARDAKDAAKNARDLEKEAKIVLVDIKVQAKTALEELKETSKKQREESSSEFERQRKINELFNKGWKAKETKDYETAADCYRQIVEEQKEDKDPDAYHNWGAALLDLAKSKKGPQAEELLNQAIEKYKNAIKIQPDSCDTYNNWGAALAVFAESKEGKEAEELFNQAIEKYKKAIEIKPDNFPAYNSWSTALLVMAKLKGGKDAEELLKQAEEISLKAESQKTGEGAYNLACIYARRGNEGKCKEWLKVGEKAETLDTREHAKADDDLKSVRDKEWFKKLRWEGE